MHHSDPLAQPSVIDGEIGTGLGLNTFVSKSVLFYTKAGRSCVFYFLVGN